MSEEFQEREEGDEMVITHTPTGREQRIPKKDYLRVNFALQEVFEVDETLEDK